MLLDGWYPVEYEDVIHCVAEEEVFALYNECMADTIECMSVRFELTAEDRLFFELVYEATYTNPFSEARATLDRKMTEGMSRNGGLDIDLVIQRVHDRFAEMETHGQADYRKYDSADGELLKNACLFDVFHSYLECFDDLIQKQIDAGGESCEVPFAPKVLAVMRRRGIAHADSVWAFAMFYQLRRAFFFIRNSLVGDSAGVRQLRMRLWNNVFTADMRIYIRYLWNRMEDFSTLLLGETGTGKGAAAWAIGRSCFIPFDERSGRFKESFTQTFVSINLSQFTEGLIESELFGHKKGAFTGAIHEHEGLFSRCSAWGAIFLDEVGELSVPVQIKLLQVLQERVFSPVGSHEKKRFSGRVIAATNQSVDQLRIDGTFRDDFYYRLCSDVILVPPLRQRLAEDATELHILVRHLFRRLAGDDTDALVGVICNKLAKAPGADYEWPGNVRELEQAIRRILLSETYEGDASTSKRPVRDQVIAGIDAGTLTASELLGFYCHSLYQRCQSYEEVGRRTGLDRRTAKKYIESAK